MTQEQTITQKRVALVVTALLAIVRKDAGEADAASAMLEEMLDELRSNDGFGTEAQSDPRGDFRNGTWFMERVEGLDNKVKQLPSVTTQQRVILVLERILANIIDNEDDAEMFDEAFEFALK